MASALTGAIAQLANELFRGPEMPSPGTTGASPPAGTPAPSPSPVELAVPEGLATSLVEPAVAAEAAPSVAAPGAPAPEVPAAPTADAPYFLSLAGLPGTSLAPAEPKPASVSLQRTAVEPTEDQALWVLIRDSARAVSFDAPGGFDLPASIPLIGPGALPVAAVATGTAPQPSFSLGETPKPPPRASAPPEMGAYEFQPELAPQTVPGGDDARPPVGPSPGLFDPYTVKRDFPILRERVRGRPLVWLDNAATTQKPQAVIDRLSSFYEHENSNVHRAAHTLAARATDAYEGAREKVRRFLNAPAAREIVFVRGTTEGINLIAQSWGRRNVGPGDEIVITWLEHHANIVPWQMLCNEKGARLKVAPVDSRGDVILEEYERLLGPRTRIVSFSQVSNALGTVVPAREMVAMAQRHGARVVVDGAQAVSHLPVDVQLLGCDFYVFSGHKIFAPTGIGAVFGKAELLDTMPPWQGGGNMIADVTFERTVYQAAPARFEAGTGNIADAVGLGAALDYVSSIGLPNIGRHEHDLRVYAEGCLSQIPGLRIIGNAREKAGVVSFVLDGIRTEEVGGLLDQEGIAVRSGHHCAQPILRRFGLEATVRASLAPYNTREDIDALVAAVRRLVAGTPASTAPSS